MPISQLGSHVLCTEAEVMSREHELTESTLLKLQTSMHFVPPSPIHSEATSPSEEKQPIYPVQKDISFLDSMVSMYQHCHQKDLAD